MNSTQIAILLAACLYFSSCYEMMDGAVTGANSYLDAEIEIEKERRKRDLEDAQIALEARRVAALEKLADSKVESEKRRAGETTPGAPRDQDKAAKLRIITFLYANKKVFQASDSDLREISNNMLEATNVPASTAAALVSSRITNSNLSISTKQRLLKELRIAINPRATIAPR